MPTEIYDGKSIERLTLDAIIRNKPLERLMIFIDGGYLRRLFKDVFGDENIDFSKLRNDLIKWYNDIPDNLFKANPLRICFYDGIVDSSKDPTAYKEQKQYFDSLEKNNFAFDVILGESIKLSDGGFRQKGVDVILAIDSLSMAYLDEYDSGFFLLGDRDFIPLIEAVKSAGKRTFGFYYDDNKVADELIRSFDFRLAFNKTRMKLWRMN